MMNLDVGTFDGEVDMALLERVREIKPLLREEAAVSERLGRTSDRSLAALKQAGVWKMLTPKYYGGYESSFRTVAEVLTTVVSACPSVGWSTTLTMAHWTVARSDDKLQDEIFGANPGPVIPSVFGTFGARAVRVEGGAQIVGGGRWKFNSGCSEGDWDILAAVIDEPDASESRVRLVIPMAELQIVDDWQVVGAAATGSMTVTCGDLFIPDHRILSERDDPVTRPVSTGAIDSIRQADNPYYNFPTIYFLALPAFVISSGTLRGAIEVFLETLPGRKLTHTDYLKASEAPITHLQVGQAALNLSAIEAIKERHVNRIMAWKSGDTAPTPRQVSETTATASYTNKLARDAIDLLFQGSGSSVIREENPVQRYHRDIQAFSQHALMHPDTQIENIGRVFCGQPPFGGAARTMPKAHTTPA